MTMQDLQDIANAHQTKLVKISNDVSSLQDAYRETQLLLVAILERLEMTPAPRRKR